MILGGSSGLGAATALKLAQSGFDLVIVHRDRKSDGEAIEAMFQAIRQQGAMCHSFNSDAVHPGKQEELWTLIKNALKGAKIKVLVHSIAKGNLKPMRDIGSTLTNQDFQLTLQAMGLSLFDWVKRISENGGFEEDARIIAFTSEGEVMGVRHKELPVVGVQFHPESILTEHGKRILQNFLEDR